MEKKSIGSFIAILRKVNGMTQRDLAEKLGVSDKTVSHWERDESAPDLTLIPVIAEVFGVTCDELLRGEKIKDSSEESTGKTEKQVKHLLGRSREKFKTRSMVSLGLSVGGLFMALVCNFGFDRAYLAFFIGCIFWASAVICESVFVSYAFSAVAGDDFAGSDLNDYKIYAVRLAESIICVPAIMLGASLPFAIIPPSAFLGVTAGTWLLSGLLGAAALAAICLFTTYTVNNSLIRKGVYALLSGADIKRHNISRLKVRCTAVTAAVLLALFLGQAVFNGAAGPQAFSAGTSFSNFDDFKAYMETEKPGEGEKAVQLTGGVAVEDFGDPAAAEAAATEYIRDNAGNDVSEFVRANWEVVMFTYSGAGTDKFSAITYTAAQLRAGESVRGFINTVWAGLYLAAAGIGFLVYFRKRSKLIKGM